jgi:hypothetical protein
LGDTKEARAVADEKPARKRRPIWPLALGGALVLMAAVLAFLLIRSLPVPKVLGSIQITSDGRMKGDFFWIKSLATDGSRVYFSELMGDHTVLAQSSVLGGETVPIPAPFSAEPQITDFSQSRSELLVGDSTGAELEWPFYVLPCRVGLLTAGVSFVPTTPLGRPMANASFTPMAPACIWPGVTEAHPTNSRLWTEYHFSLGGRPTEAGCALP